MTPPFTVCGIPGKARGSRTLLADTVEGDARAVAYNEVGARALKAREGDEHMAATLRVPCDGRPCEPGRPAPERAGVYGRLAARLGRRPLS
ncbi:MULTISPECIES: hypothetical protein [Streptomyces]|uniref:Uncharacterized protein n=1 Tax=Streptomyces dengpaensis TaxID=2049881 RepID=A0ABM6SNU4_9ACTN|nr:MULTISPECIES: hypothetical protein [Streptomyces]AVH56346.1 hypothetical protein C4B68_11810 [Streptomyces dengpaensis]PIB05688.1 hypothetical protein B1C81_27985 [Streptomyces sp. HG99]